MGKKEKKSWGIVGKVLVGLRVIEPENALLENYIIGTGLREIQELKRMKVLLKYSLLKSAALF